MSLTRTAISQRELSHEEAIPLLRRGRGTAPAGENIMNDKNRYIFPNRQDATRGAHIPPWMFSLDLSPDLKVTYAVLARCAGTRRNLSGYSIRRLAAVAGFSENALRRNLQALIDARLIERVDEKPGTIPTFRFLRHPRSKTAAGDFLTWRGLVAAVDAAGYAPDWRTS